MLIKDWVIRCEWPRWLLKRIILVDPFDVAAMRCTSIWRLWLLGAPVLHILIPPDWQATLPRIIAGELYPPLPAQYAFRLPWRQGEPITDGEVKAWEEYIRRGEHVLFVAAAFGRQPEVIADAIPLARFKYCHRLSSRGWEPPDVVAARCVERWGKNWSIQKPPLEHAAWAALILFKRW